jgi:NADH:ubiquinone oxidoreductase subunit 5 (subunit L)/multisubunit Na+/H+ antiporter MnhA subunit
LLVAVGVTSGVLGVLLALAQHDLKRLLAYHSVENVGIIALGLGLGLVGLHVGSPALAVLGFAGGLLHVVNHAVFKGLLFLGAGALLQATGTREIDALGGLLGRMPRTGLAFLIGAAAICGLPPLNGFVSEFLIYLSALGAAASLGIVAAVPGLVVIAALALIGGLAIACFTKAFGVIFLGEARSAHAADAQDPGLRMRLPMQILAATCLVIGLGSPLLIGPLAPVLGQVTGLASDTVSGEVMRIGRALEPLSACAVGLLGLVALVAALRRWLLAGRSVTTAVTWDCGFRRPSPRMQYTASSFAQPLTDLFAPLIGTRRRLVLSDGFFPRTGSFASETPDPYRERLYRPAFRGIDKSLSAFRWLQHGRVQLYVLYIAFTLIALLLWTLGVT